MNITIPSISGSDISPSGLDYTSHNLNVNMSDPMNADLITKRQVEAMIVLINQ